MKTIVIFGATGGLGSSISKKLLEKNEYNIITLGSKNLDVSDYEKVSNFFNENEVDIVINLSGLNFDKFTHKITSNDIQNIEEQINVNIKGNINIVSSCLNKMREKNYGRIILFSSVLAEKPVVSTSIYSGCKGFLDSFVKTVALENASKNITCNTIQLGYFDGGLTYKIPQDFLTNIVNNIPTKRLGTIEELENTILFLINTPYINGINLKINGGIDF
jgi:NAD(P)-dependent dehydrogenase (short-subunit alcohol dehydrogenase family)